MSRTLDIPLPEGARLVAGSMAAAGYGTLLVGGTVRDALLGRPVADVDLATEAPVDDIRDLLARLPWVDAMWDSGIRFGTLGVSALGTRVEITRFRGEACDAPDIVTRFACDAEQRDFTVNALAVRLPNNELLDPVGGIDDLESRIMRAPGDPVARFEDDTLRVLRLARFVAELGFGVDPETHSAAARIAPHLAGCSGERIHAELWRLLEGEHVRDGLTVLRDVGGLKAIAPALRDDDDALATVAALPVDPERRIAALAMDLTDSELDELCHALRCSRAQARRARFFLEHGLESDPDARAVSPLGGNAIIAELGVTPGPMVGLVKSALTAAVADGLLDPDDREGALYLARSVLGVDELGEEHDR